jgi:hypothetical protein
VYSAAKSLMYGLLGGNRRFFKMDERFSFFLYFIFLFIFIYFYLFLFIFIYFYLFLFIFIFFNLFLFFFYISI